MLYYIKWTRNNRIKGTAAQDFPSGVGLKKAKETWTTNKKSRDKKHKTKTRRGKKGPGLIINVLRIRCNIKRLWFLTFPLANILPTTSS